MKSLRESRYILPLTIVFIFILNIAQGGLTELLPDESYYWIYSNYFDWGFFDHPPLVALWILISDYFFSDELGVRFFSAVSFSLMSYIVWLTIDHPRKNEYAWLFVLIYFSTALINVYGFITTPDTPLMLFCALFLFAYQQYLKSKSLLSYLLLTISISGMMYSKYQGLLIILFVVLSNWKLVKDYKLWLVCLFSLFIYVPYLHWQWINDFPSFRYHLEERVSYQSYKLEYTLTHFLNTLVIVGFTFPIIYKAFFKNISTKKKFSKSLNFIIIGFFMFFFIASFRGRVQAQWIVAISIPLILISFDYLIKDKNSRKWFIRLAFVNISLLFIIRVLISNEEILPVKLDFHGNEKWALELQSKTLGKKKIFVNSFQNISTYWFYTKEKAYYMKNFTGRKNHFSMLQKNTDLSGDSIAFVTKNKSSFADVVTHQKGEDYLYTFFIDHYQDLSQIEIHFMNEEVVFEEDKTTDIEIEIKNNFDRIININEIDFSIVIFFDKLNFAFVKDVKIISNDHLIEKNNSIKAVASFLFDNFPEEMSHRFLGIGISNSQKTDIHRASELINYRIEK